MLRTLREFSELCELTQGLAVSYYDSIDFQNSPHIHFYMTVSRTICLGFLVLIAVGTLLLWLPISTSTGEWNTLVTALFTATSAVGVTGLIVVDTGSY